LISHSDKQLVAACDYAAIGGRLVLGFNEFRDAQWSMRRVADMLSMADYPFAYSTSEFMIEIKNGHIVFRGAMAPTEPTMYGSNRIFVWGYHEFREFRHSVKWNEISSFQKQRFPYEWNLWQYIATKHGVRR
jgi:hypothetical protein